MGLSDYMTYNATSLNCQNFILNGLKANALNTNATETFIYQYLTKLVEETPSFSKWLSEKATDLASSITRPIEELLYKRGGIFNPTSRKYRRVGHF